MTGQQHFPVYNPLRQRKRDEAKAVELELGRRIQQGDRQAEADLIARYERYALKTAARFAQHYNAWHLLDDLGQQARIGLTIAARKYDPDKNFRFYTYCRWWVWSECRHFVHETTKTIRIPDSIWNEYYKLLNAANEGEESDLTPEEIERIRSAMTLRTLPIDPSAERDQKGIVRDVTDDQKFTPAQQTELNSLLAKLNHRDLTLLTLRFVWGFTLQEAAQELSDAKLMRTSVTRERIRQIEADILDRLRQRMKL